MEIWFPVLLTFLGTLAGSTGLWTYLERKNSRKSAQTQLLLGLAHERIIFQGMSYVDRGWITKDEYEDFDKYLYKPYSQFGGNGLAERVMNEVNRLPIRGSHNPIVQVVKEKNVPEQPPER